jgi:hypothetical protein
MFRTLRGRPVLCVPPVSKLLALSGHARLRIAERVLIHGLELVAQPLRLAQLERVTRFDRVLVFLLPALPPLLRRLRGALFGLPDRALILGFPPTASLPGLVGNSLRDLQESPLGLLRPHRPLILFALPQLFGLSGGALEVFVGNALLFRLPPRTQLLRFSGDTLQGLPEGTLVFGFPPLAQFGRLSRGALPRFLQDAPFLSGPALPQLTELSRCAGDGFTQLTLLVGRPTRASLANIGCEELLAFSVQPFGLRFQAAAELLGVLGDVCLSLALGLVVFDLPAAAELIGLPGRSLLTQLLTPLVLGLPSAAQRLSRCGAALARLLDGARFLRVQPLLSGRDLRVPSLLTLEPRLLVLDCPALA